MLQPQELLSRARGALEGRPELDLHDCPIGLDVHDDVLVMTGVMRDITAKRVARLAVVAALGVEQVRDELCVAPAQQRSDAEIAATLERMFSQESAFRDYPITVRVDAQLPAPPAASQQGAITAAVHDGVVTLAGRVGSLTHRRLADVLAWWTPGTCAVRNFLHVVPDEKDSDAEVSDALRIVLDKDPWLDAATVRVRVHGKVVTLEGQVSSPEQRRMAEQDAWYVLGVHGVQNHLQVGGPHPD